MARISFSALIESITGKLAGSVFQDSYGGFQIRTRVSPRNPQTNYQQLRRGEFGFISALWRTLTTLQRQSFIDASSTPPAALNLFIQANVNLTLIEESIISTYNVTTAPILFPLQINDLTPSTFIIQASSGTVVVPAGTKLLVFGTTDRGATQIFTNPSAFSPLLSLDEGTDLSIPIDIISDWNDRYGVMRLNRNVCVKSVLIDKTNGNRGVESIICAVSDEMNKFIRLESDFTQVDCLGPANTTCYPYNLPANTLANDGDSLIFSYWGSTVGGVLSKQVQALNPWSGVSFDTITASSKWLLEVSAIRMDAGTLRTVYKWFLDGQLSSIQEEDIAIDLTVLNLIRLKLTAGTAGTCSALAGFINLELT